MRFLRLALVAFAICCAAAPLDAGSRRDPSRANRRDGKVVGALYWFGVHMVAQIRIENDVLVKTTVTDANGNYEFKSPAGVYLVTAPGPWASEPFRTEVVIVESGKVQVVDFWFW